MASGAELLSIHFWENKVAAQLPSNCRWTKVADFINTSNQTWDLGKLRSCISEEVVLAISKIPISCTKTKDKRIWALHRSGKYTVKAGYHQAIMKAASLLPAKASSSYSPSKSMWTRLWSIPTAPKVCIFMWKVVRNWIACKANVFKCNCSFSPLCPICQEAEETVDHTLFHCPWTKPVWFGSGNKCNCSFSPLCPICQEAEETVDHTLFHCPWTKPVWFGSGKSFWILDRLIGAADRWMEELLSGSLVKESPVEEVAAIFQICWTIWKARNAFIFEGKTPYTRETIDKASEANCDYLRALFVVRKGSGVKHVRDSKWVPPPLSVVKFSSDGAFNSSRSLAAFGVIAKDSGGAARCWRVGRVLAGSAIFIEAWALRIACITAIEMRFDEVIFEFDCLELVTS